jgi:hypothetical protein
MTPDERAGRDDSIEMAMMSVGRSGRPRGVFATPSGIIAGARDDAYEGEAIRDVECKDGESSDGAGLRSGTLLLLPQETFIMEQLRIGTHGNDPDTFIGIEIEQMGVIRDQIVNSSSQGRA